MGPSDWTIYGIFGLTQIVSFLWVFSSMRSDNKVLQVQMKDVREELKQIAKIIIMQVEQKAEMISLNDRLVLTGKRVDETSSRLNKFVDAIVFNANTRAMLFPNEPSQSSE